MECGVSAYYTRWTFLEKPVNSEMCVCVTGMTGWPKTATYVPDTLISSEMFNYIVDS